MATAPPRPTFLGIPPELRLHIYGYAVLLDASFDERPSQYYTDDISRAKPFCQDIQLPWLNLLRTCKLVASELHSFITSEQFHSREQNRTWEVDATSDNWMFQRRITRLRLPCNHRHVKAVVITTTLPSDRNAAEDHIAMDIVRFMGYSIFMPLNISGPRMEGSWRLSPQPLFRKCTFNVIDSSPPSEQNGKKPDMTMFRQQFQGFHMLGYYVDETTFNIYKAGVDGMELTGRLVFFRNVLVEASGYQMTPLVCKIANVNRWKAYKQSKRPSISSPS